MTQQQRADAIITILIRMARARDISYSEAVQKYGKRVEELYDLIKKEKVS